MVAASFVEMASISCISANQESMRGTLSHWTRSKTLFNWPSSWTSSDHMADGVLLVISDSLPCGLLLLIGGGQLGPNALPIVGAQLFAGDLAFSRLLDQRAVLGGHGPALDPCGHSGLNNATVFSEFLL